MTPDCTDLCHNAFFPDSSETLTAGKYAFFNLKVIVLMPIIQTYTDTASFLMDKQRPAIWPLKLVAEFLFMKIDSVRKKMQAGALDTIQIGTHEYISESTLAKDFKDIDNLYIVLKNAAVKRELITYGDAMAKIGLDVKKPSDRSRIGFLAGAVSRQSYSVNKCFLSILLVEKRTNLPSKNGFLSLLQTLNIPGNYDANYDDFVRKNQQCVFNATWP